MDQFIGRSLQNSERSLQWQFWGYMSEARTNLSFQSLQYPNDYLWKFGWQLSFCHFNQIHSCQSGNLRSYWIVVICVGIIGPILVTSFGYFLLFRQVKQVRRAVSAIGGGQRGLGGSIHKHDRSNSSEDDRLKLTLTLFCCSLAACWGPLIVINILRVIQVTYSFFWSIEKRHI